MIRNGIAANAGCSIWNAVKAATSSIKFKGDKDTPFEPRSESEVTRRDRNDGAGHRLLENQQSCRWIVRGVIPANLSSTRGEASGDNKKSTNVTYGTAI